MSAAQARDDARTDRRRGGVTQQLPVFSARDDRVATVECGQRAHGMQGASRDFMALRERCQTPWQCTPQPCIEQRTALCEALQGERWRTLRQTGIEALRAQSRIGEHKPQPSREPLLEFIQPLRALLQAYAGMGEGEPSTEARQLLIAGAQASRGELLQWRIERCETGAPRCAVRGAELSGPRGLSLTHISEPTRLRRTSNAVFCVKKNKETVPTHSCLDHR